MYSKYIPRLIHYIELGDLEKIEWCLVKDKIDLNQEYILPFHTSHADQSILAYVVLNEETIPQSEEVLEMLVRYGGNLYQPGSNYGESRRLTDPFVAFLGKREQRRQCQRDQASGRIRDAKELHFDEQGLIEKLFREHPSTSFYHMQEAAQVAADAFDFEMLEMVFNNGAKVDLPPRDGSTYPLIRNLRYTFDEERDNVEHWKRDKMPEGNLLLDRVCLEQALPLASGTKQKIKL